MKNKEFDELLTSILQAGAMHRGERRASRSFRFTPLDVKKIREKAGRSQTQFSQLIHVSIKTLQN